MQIQITIDTEKDAGKGNQLAAIANILGTPVEAALPVKLTAPTIATDPEPLSTVGKVKKTAKPTKKSEAVEDAPTFEALQTKAKEVVKAGKRDDYKAALARFNAKRINEVAEESYLALGHALDALLEV